MQETSMKRDGYLGGLVERILGRVTCQRCHDSSSRRPKFWFRNFSPPIASSLGNLLCLSQNCIPPKRISSSAASGPLPIAHPIFNGSSRHCEDESCPRSAVVTQAWPFQCSVANRKFPQGRRRQGQACRHSLRLCKTLL